MERVVHAANFRTNRTALNVALAFAAIGIGIGVRTAFGLLLAVWSGKGPEPSVEGYEYFLASGAAALGFLCFGAVQPAVGKLTQLVGYKHVLTASLGLIGLGIAALSQAASLFQLYLIYGIVISIGIAGASMVPVTAAVSEWTKIRQGVLAGLVLAGGALGQVAIVPAIETVLRHYHWGPGLLMVSTLPLLATIACATLMVRASALDGSPQHGQVSNVGNAKDVGRSMLLLVAVFGISGLVTTGFIETHLVLFAVTRGVTMADAAAMMATIGGANIVGTLCSGWAADRVKPDLLLSWIVLVRIIALVALIAIDDKIVLLPFCIVFGLTNFAMVPVVTVLVRRISGEYAAPRLFGWAAASHQIGSAVGALMGGLAFWQSQSFSWALVVCIALSAYSLVLLRTLGRILRTEPSPSSLYGVAT